MGPQDASKNGAKGDFGLVNIEAGTNADMVFSFSDEMGAPVTPPHGFTFTILDIDNHKAGKNIERFTIELTEFSSFTPGSLVEVMDNGSVMTFSSVPEAGEDKNPSNALKLDDEQKSRSVAFIFPAVDEFRINFEVANTGDRATKGG